MATQKKIHNLHYNAGFLSGQDKTELLTWLKTLHPIWEFRFSKNNPPPPEDEQRRLLRPVYWLGNWQFACLDYFHPPKGIDFRCVKAEVFPPVLQKLVNKMEESARRMYHGADMPTKWHLNTCLVNFYGDEMIDGKKIDNARVGDHQDFEPGPVASLSLGERAFFQFVHGKEKDLQKKVVHEQWLTDGSMLIFGGKKWKEETFHRVQRVENKGVFQFPLSFDNFFTRRINFTFRYVPIEHILPLNKFPAPFIEDVLPYVKELAPFSRHFAKILDDLNQK